jgi:hypothetical protein
MKRALAAAMIRRGLKERGLPVTQLESKHVDPNLPLFNDSSYFLGRGDDGSCMVVRLAFRSTRDPEYWLKFHLPGKGTFELKELDTIEGDGFRLGDLYFACLEPGKRWKIGYSGPIHHVEAPQKDGVHEQGQEIIRQADIELHFEATRPLVNFKDISRPADLAPVIAREKWNLDFFRNLKEISKVHLEQGGRITGTIRIDGEDIPVDWRSVRDHSWGTRDWGTWKRHVWLGGVLDNGEAFNLSMISYDFLGQLSAGYLTRGSEVAYFSGLPEMDSFASEPLVPRNTRIDFHSRDGSPRSLEIEMPRYFDFLMDGVYHIREGMGDFVFDGIPGKGVAEFGLNPSHYDISSL